MGLVFGLALASKLNAFALIGCGLYWLTQNLWTATKQSDGLTLPVVPLWMIVVPSVGFAVQVAALAIMWTDTISRYGAYVSFHTKHYPIYLFYEGQIWDRPFAPWRTPFKLAWAAPHAHLGQRSGRLSGACWSLWASRQGQTALRFLLIHAVVAIGTVPSHPSPNTAALNCFSPSFRCSPSPQAIGFVHSPSARPSGASTLRFDGLGAALAAVMLSTGMIDTVRFSGHELSSYGHHVGGLPGAVTARL